MRLYILHEHWLVQVWLERIPVVELVLLTLVQVVVCVVVVRQVYWIAAIKHLLQEILLGCRLIEASFCQTISFLRLCLFTHLYWSLALHRFETPICRLLQCRWSGILLDTGSRQALMTHLELLTRLNERLVNLTCRERQRCLLPLRDCQSFLDDLEEATLPYEVRFQILLLMTL